MIPSTAFPLHDGVGSPPPELGRQTRNSGPRHSTGYRGQKIHEWRLSLTGTDSTAFGPHPATEVSPKSKTIETLATRCDATGQGTGWGRVNGASKHANL